jgi:hypothetical protein
VQSCVFLVIVPSFWFFLCLQGIATVGTVNCGTVHSVRTCKAFGVHEFPRLLVSKKACCAANLVLLSACNQHMFHVVLPTSIASEVAAGELHSSAVMCCCCLVALPQVFKTGTKPNPYTGGAMKDFEKYTGM